MQRYLSNCGIIYDKGQFLIDGKFATQKQIIEKIGSSLPRQPTAGYGKEAKIKIICAFLTSGMSGKQFCKTAEDLPSDTTLHRWLKDFHITVKGRDIFLNEAKVTIDAIKSHLNSVIPATRETEFVPKCADPDLPQIEIEVDLAVSISPKLEDVLMRVNIGADRVKGTLSAHPEMIIYKTGIFPAAWWSNYRIASFTSENSNDNWQ